MVLTELEYKLKKHFIGQSFSKEDLWQFFNNQENKIPIFEFKNFISYLKNEKSIKVVSKNTYQLVNNNLSGSFIISDKMLKIVTDLSNILELMNYCIWETSWFNSFTIHQITRTYLLLEVEQDFAEAVFHQLHDNMYNDVFLILHEADELLLERYIFEAQNPIIIKKLITRAPIQKKNLGDRWIKVPKIEKILVDLFCDDELFLAYKGQEQRNIFDGAIERYDINFKTLFYYAQRRGKEAELKQFLFHNS